MTSRDRHYHKNCFTCFSCSRLLDYTNCLEGGNQNNEVYCKSCYVKEFFTGGRNRYGDRANPNQYSNQTGCKRCQGQVFEIDKVLTK